VYVGVYTQQGSLPGVLPVVYTQQGSLPSDPFHCWAEKRALPPTRFTVGLERGLSASQDRGFV